MRFSRSIFFLSLFCILGSVLSFCQDTPLSISDYEAELDRLSTLAANVASDPHACLDAARKLPPQWDVSDGNQTFRIDTTYIRAELEGAGLKPDGDAAGKLSNRLAALKADAEAFDQSPQDASASHAQINSILSRHEFRNVHKPRVTLMDRIKQWLGDLILRILKKLFGVSSISTIGKVTVWIIVGIAVLALAFWIYKIMKRNAGVESFMPEVIPVSAKEWSKWMAEAQAAAAAGNWREAIHLSYWAGISFLEERGMWRPDKARTPREYLRLLAPSSEYRGALSTLTREFEVIWYGYKEAGPESYSDTLAHLENLGCRPN
jgi:hypothetical protein